MMGSNQQPALSRQGKWGLAILFAGGLLMAGIAALPYVLYSVASDQLAASRLELKFIEAKLKSAKVARPQGLTAADNIEPLFAPGATSGTGLAGLQSLVGRLAKENGMVIERTQPLQTENNAGLAVLRMEVEAVGSIESLRGYLLAIETGQPVIFINQAKITAPQSNDQTAAALPSDKLSVALQLEAYGWWKDTP